ncbi:Tetratricopeptide repeat-containing protein [Xylanibacter ruminicola]|uniref:Tetratricopeptide repeat-containing protein n=2 Tax=Xylanibacter ruminicola TaxID=839 RepID=A0A1M7MU23_XYLRU|nr:Tetratricopeptide repeat-containing protein [Xylanibacter ruminicola]
MGMVLVVALVATTGFAQNKNTAKSRFWHAFNARYNTYYNGHMAFLDGNLEKEKGHKDNFTELLPLYPVGNKQSRDIGKSHYERTVEKMEKAIQRHTIKVKGREQNPFLWKAWLMLGKAQFQMGQFEEAAATFSYMARLYLGDPARSGLARAWLAKSYTMLGWRYDAEDVIRNMSRDSMDFRAVKDWDYTYANYYISVADYPKAVPYLRKAIKHERRKTQRAREWYLMGQIQNLMGNQQEAYKAFARVIRCSPPYELQFNARIAQTEVLAKNNGKQMIGKLKRMAANDNNAEYLDQVYYAIGNIYLAQGDTLQAIGAYEKGNQKSTRNGIEKGVLLLTLGNLYWEQEKFADAQRCYGEAIGLLDKDRKDYDELARRSKVLDELVPYTEAVHLQDSLLQLARMGEKERLQAIDRVIAELKKKEKEARDAELENTANTQQTFNQSNFGSINQRAVPQSAGAQQTGGAWYFYNPTAVSQGKATFQREWGRRENIDNWRRSNQTVVRMPSGDAANDSITASDEAAKAVGDSIVAPIDSTALDPHYREYYLAQIPFSEEQQTACHDIIKDGLFHAGIILKDKMERLNISERYLRRLTTDYPDYENNPEAWYHLWLLYSRQGRTAEAAECLTHLKADYPDNEYTLLIADPYYAENARFGEQIEDSLYAATYDAFKHDEFQVVKHNTQLSATRFAQGAHRDKFVFISGLSLLNEGDGDGCLEQLNEVVEKYPDSEVSPLAGMIIKGVQDGRKLRGGKFDIGDVWTQRDIVLKRDSSTTDTLSTDRGSHYLFMLVYQPDSVNQNQLLFELARYNFTNFLVRNFEIQIDQDGELNRMLVSGFLSYDEALQYARMLYDNETLRRYTARTMRLIVSEQNLPLLGTQYTYDEYQQFYERELAPMQVSKDNLLINPEAVDAPDIEDELPAKPAEQPAPATQKKQQKVLDFDDDFW